MAGGMDGMRGLNLWVRNDPLDGSVRTINMGGKATAEMSAGDRIIVHTPGGGGYGVPGSEDTPEGLGEGEYRVHKKFVRNPHLFRAAGSLANRESLATSN